MVTIQEVRARRAELQEVEGQAQQIVDEEVPQRRFGSRVTPEQQRQILARKQRARQALAKIQKQKTQLAQVEIQLQAQRQGRATSQAERDYEIAYKFVVEGKPAYALTRKQRRIYDQIQRGVEVRQSKEEQKRKLREQGLEPIYDAQGKLVGFEDQQRLQTISVEEAAEIIREDPREYQRFERAGITITRQEDGQSSFTPTTLREEILRQSLPAGEREFLDPLDFGVPVSPTLKSPSRFLTQLKGGIMERSRFLPTPFEGAALISERGRELKAEFVKQRTLFIEGLIPTTKTDVVLTVGTLGLGAAIGASLRGTGAILKGVGGVPLLLKGEKVVAAAGVYVAGRFVTTRFTEITGRAIVPDIKAFPIGARFPKVSDQKFDTKLTGITARETITLTAGTKAAFKVIDFTVGIKRTLGLKRLSAELVEAPEFYGGQTYPRRGPGDTLGQLRKEFETPILPSEINRVIRLEGYTGKGQIVPINEYKSIPVKIPKFQAGFTARPIGDVPSLFPEGKTPIGTSEFPGQFSAPKISPKFLRIDVQNERVVGFSGILTGGEPTAIRTQFPTIEFAPGTGPRTTGSSGVPGIKKLQNLFKDIQGTGRTVIPGTKTEKEAITAALSEVTPPVVEFYYQTPTGRRVPIIETKVISGPAIKVPGVPKTTLKDVSSSYAPPVPSSRVYPISFAYSIPKSSYSVPSSKVSSMASSVSKATSIPFLSSYSGISASSGYPRPPSRPIVAYSISSSTTSPPRYPSQPYRPTTTGRPLTSPPYSPPKKPPKRPPISIRRDKREEELKGLLGFRTFVIKGGKKVFLPGIRPKGRALRAGAIKTRATLRATFGVEATGVRVRQRDITYRPPKSVFRGFKIKGEQKVPLRDTFIQKAGTRREPTVRGARLATKSEQKALLRALKVRR